MVKITDDVLWEGKCFICLRFDTICLNDFFQNFYLKTKLNRNNVIKLCTVLNVVKSDVKYPRAHNLAELILVIIEQQVAGY